MANKTEKADDIILSSDITNGKGIFEPRDQREAMLMIEMRTKVLAKAQELTTRAIVELDENNTLAHKDLADKIDDNREAVIGMFTETLTSINTRLDNQGSTYLHSKVFYFIIALVIMGMSWITIDHMNMRVDIAGHHPQEIVETIQPEVK